MELYPVAWQERTNKKNIACSRPALFILSVPYIRKTQIMSHSRLTNTQPNGGLIFFLIFLVKNHQFFLTVDFKQLLGISQLFLIEYF